MLANFAWQGVSYGWPEIWITSLEKTPCLKGRLWTKFDNYTEITCNKLQFLEVLASFCDVFPGREPGVFSVIIVYNVVAEY